MKTKKYPLVICSKEDNCNIVFSEFSDNLKVDLSTAEEIVANRLEFTENKKHYLIINISNVQQVTLEAKEFMAKADAGLKNILGSAFVASNPVSALLANIMIKATPSVPSKFFSSQRDALSWIKELKLKHRNN